VPSKLESIFNSLYDAVISAQQAVELQQLQNINKDYFDEDGNAKTIALNLPDDSGKMAIKNIPLLSLARHDSLSIDEVVIKMNVELGNGEVGILSSLTRRHDARSSVAELTIKFKGQSPAEGLARIDDKLVKTI
tara:strand:- start:775 stop:1176 length:402 start_codon:yes stop_codon:yes gene_type:complete